MIALSVSKLKKTYGIDLIFDDVSFSINEREKVAIVGPNGAGKTTLFNIIVNQEPKDSGEIFIAKDKKIGYMSQNVNISSEKTVYEEAIIVFEELIKLEECIRSLEDDMAKYHDDEEKIHKLMKQYSDRTEEFTKKDGYVFRSKTKGVLIGLGFTEQDLEKNVNLLSGGEKSRLLLAKILLQEPDILLMDEPTNHLDMQSISWLETFLKNLNATIIIISHDRYFLNTLTTKTIDMSNNTAKVYNCNYENYTIQKDKDFELEMKNYQQNQQEIKRQEEIIEKLKSFGREKQVKRARSREKALEKMEVIDKPMLQNYRSNIIFECSVKSGKDVLKVRDLSKAYGENVLFKDVEMDIYSGEKIAIIGPNGAGKTTFFNILLGEETQDKGTVDYGVNVNRQYFNQERTDLNMQNTLLEEIWSNYPNLTQVQVRNYLAGFLFTGDEVFKKISDLSGGEKSRISLLKLMLSKSNCLFMDEPTNHLDIESKEVLEDAICAYDGTVFVISHDRYFLNKVPDRIFELVDGNFVEYLGNYEYMIDKKNKEKEYNEFLKSQEETVSKTSIKNQKKKSKQEEAEKRRIKKQEKEILEEIELLEQETQNIDLSLCEEEVYTNPEKVKELTAKKTNIQEEIKILYKRWDEIMLLIQENEE